MSWRVKTGTINESKIISNEELSVEWQIQDVLLLSSESDRWYESCEISFCDQRWWLGISLTHESIARRFSKENLNSAKMRFRLIRRGRQPDKTFYSSVSMGGVEKRIGEEIAISNQNCYIWDNICSRSDLIECKSSLMPEGILTIKCVIRTSSAKENELREEVNVLKKRIGKYEDQINKLEGQMNKYDAKIHKSLDENKQLEAKSSVACQLEKENEDLKREVNVLEEQMKRFEERVKKYDSDIQNQKSLNDNLRKKLLSHEKDYAVQLRVKSSTACKLVQENSGFKAQIDQLQKDYLTLQKEKVNLDEKKNYFEKEFRRLEDSKPFRKEDIVEKVAQISELKKENCDYKAEIEKLQDDYQTLVKEKTKLGEEKSYFETEFKKLKELEPFRNRDIDKISELKRVHIKDEDPSSMNNRYQDILTIPCDNSALFCDFSDLYADEISPNFVLKCNKWNLPVNTFVLSVRSEFFRNMFWNRMDESDTGSAEINDLKVPVLLSMLRFLYCGKLEGVSDDTFADLYEAGSKYSLSLKMACRSWMERNLTWENCITFLTVSDSLSDQDLRSAVVSFIFQNPEVMKTSAWLTFSKQHRDLANEMLQAYLSSIIP